MDFEDWLLFDGVLAGVPWLPVTPMTRPPYLATV
jgi:hypothetical protein